MREIYIYMYILELSDNISRRQIYPRDGEILGIEGW